MFRTALLKILLVFTLLFAQQGAVVHSIAHTLAEQSQDQSLPHDKHCELCATYAQLGSAIGSASVHFDFTQDTVNTFNAASYTYHSSTFAAFSARAPPYFA